MAIRNSYIYMLVYQRVAMFIMYIMAAFSLVIRYKISGFVEVSEWNIRQLGNRKREKIMLDWTP